MNMSIIDTEDIAKRIDYGTQIQELLDKWETLINKVSMMEIEYYQLKEEIFNEEQKIIKNTDFNALYGANNKDVRKEHLDKSMKEQYDLRKALEIDIDANKRRIYLYAEKVKCLREFMQNGC